MREQLVVLGEMSVQGLLLKVGTCPSACSLRWSAGPSGC